MRPLYTEPVTSLDKCRVTLYWVIKYTLRNNTQWERGVLHDIYTILYENGGKGAANDKG